MPNSDQSARARTEQLLSLILDPLWYRARHRDVAASGGDPLRHFIDHGLRERRDPNRWFDGAWYTRRYPDVAASGAHPLLHYMSEGAGQQRDPHPRFDAGWYIAQHPEAAGNALLFHLRTGAARGWLTEQPVAIEDWLPSRSPPLASPAGVAVDIVIPAYRGLALTRRCLASVLADSDRPTGRIVVVDDASPEPKLSAWLDQLAAAGKIDLLRNKKNLGFVASVNRGMRHAGRRDVVLLNADTEVPRGWLRRLQAQAFAAGDIASVSPLTNNGSICGWLSHAGAPMPPALTLAAIDAACREANAGRSADTPTTVGFCMYIRRAALDAAGLFDTKTFGKGYGEENDFCLRATALGWRHRIACDTFVFHAGSASFGAAADDGIARAYAILTERYPDYARSIAEHVGAAATAPFRFAAAMALSRASGLPTTLLLSHDLDGGVRRHVDDVIAREAGQTNFLLLEPAPRGIAISVPALPGLPKLIMASERWRDAAQIARSGGVTRVHIHHLMGLDLDARELIHELGVTFDVTVHDYHAICPQVTLLPWPAAPYCEEPGPAGCDACIANRPSHGATDILSWRLDRAWPFHEADRVFAPSGDMLHRLRRHGLAQYARVLPHEPVPSGPWKVRRQRVPSAPLVVAVLGVLADHKGAQVVASVALAADPADLTVLAIGGVQATIPDEARQRMTIHGPYRDAGLPALLARYRPDIVWFPASWPETYSYTLSAALAAELPVAAADIGAFPERLAGRPLTWLLKPTLDPRAWLTLFETAAEELRAYRPPRRPPPRTVAKPEPVLPDGGRKTAVLVIPETFDDGSYTPCAHIRLLRPLDHPGIGRDLAITVASAAAAPRHRADIVMTQRHAVPSIAAAETLAAHAKRIGATLIYDLDDDLLTIPPDHPEAAELTAQVAMVERMIGLADVTRTSTPALADRVAALARRVQVESNALDERIWLAGPRRPADEYGPVRILCMGTATHDGDFALLLPALTEIHRRFGDQIQIDLIGFVAAAEVPVWIRRLAPSPVAARSYPGFVHWLRWSGPWDIGLAPLADTPFNACKSPIKVFDHAALGLASIASDVPAYRGSLADGKGGILVPNTRGAWSEALSLLIRDRGLRRRLAEAGGEALAAEGTLAARATSWREGLIERPRHTG